MGKLEGKVAIITGGGKGIGFGLAKAFAKEGANLTITGRTMSRLEAAKEKLEAEYGVKVLPITADGADEASVANVVKQTVETFGHIDTVVNNAQVSKSGVMLKDHTKEDFDLAIYSGLYATFFYMRDAYPYLKESKGRIINFGSGSGTHGSKGMTSYGTSKEAIRGMTKILAVELAKDGINVNVICPLAWTAKLEQFQQAYPEAFKANVKMPPMGHYGNAELEIGRVCVQLAMPDFKFMSGETLTLEGGMGQRP